MLLPIKAKNPPESIPFATIGLLVVNVVAFALTSDNFFVGREEIIRAYGVTKSNPSLVKHVTSMFLHGDILHLLGNMWFLYLFGFAVEGRLRTAKFLLLYFAAGFAGDALQLGLMSGPKVDNIPLIGASGAIMGVIGAAIYMFPYSVINTFYWVGMAYIGVAEWAMWWVGLYYLGLDFVFGMSSLGSKFGGGTAHFAHLGGAAAGLLTALIVRAKRDDEYMSETKALLDEVKDLRVLNLTQISEMASQRPDDPEIALHWMTRALERGQPGVECANHFNRHIGALLRSPTLGLEFAQAIFKMVTNGIPVQSSLLVDVASQVERQGQPQIAISLLERVRKSQESTEDERMQATYRCAMHNETWFQNYSGAWNLYSEVIQRWPMSELAPQAKQRLQVLQQIAQQRRT